MKTFFLLAVTALVLSLSSTSTAHAAAAAGAAGNDKCSASAQLFSCPNCDGIEVTDCLTQCDGFLNTDLVHNMCFSRKLFNNYDASTDDPSEHYHYLWNDILGAIIWFLAAGVATACGVGGGGIYVPLGIMLLRFAPKPASGLSQASIFGASLGGLLLNSKAKYPNTKIKNEACQRDDDGNVVFQEPPDETDEQPLSLDRKYYTRPLIDYDMALFLAPMEMAGAVLGTIIQKIMPNWLYLLLASVILAFTSYKTYTKFFAARAKEKLQLEKQREREERRSLVKQMTSGDEAKGGTKTALEGTTFNEGSADESPSVSRDVETPKETSSDTSSELVSDEKEITLRTQYLEEDSRQFPREKLIALLILWIGLIIITFFKGGKGVDSPVGITCQSPWFAVLIAMQFLWTMGFATLFAIKLLKRQRCKDAVRYPYQPHDVMWDSSKVRFYSAFTFIAGVVAGLIGIGGGMVLGPLMLVMGIHPRVSTATTATMIVLTSSSVAIMFVTAGLVPWSYAVFFFSICFTGAFIGKRYIDGYVKKTGKSSLLIVILATIIALATTGCLVIVFTSLARDNWCFSGFKPFCSVKSDSTTCVGQRLMSIVEDAVFPQS